MGAIAIVLTTAADILSIPVIYGINKRRTDLGLPPYSYSSVIEGVFKLLQILSTKISFFKKNRSLSLHGIIDTEGIAESVSSDWDEENAITYEARTQFFSEKETGEEEKGVSETGICAQVFFERETEDQTAQNVAIRDQQGGIMIRTGAHVSLRRKTLDKEDINGVWNWGDAHAHVFSTTEPDKGKAKVVKVRGEGSVAAHDRHAPISLGKANDEGTVKNASSQDGKCVTTYKACVQMSVENASRKEVVENVTSEKIVVTDKPCFEVSTGTETGERIVGNIGDEDKGKGTKNHSMIVMKKETAVDVRDCDEERVNKDKARANFPKEKEPAEGSAEDAKDLDWETVNTYKVHFQLSKETGKPKEENIEDFDDFHPLETSTIHKVREGISREASEENVREFGEETVSTHKVRDISEAGLISRAPEFQTNEEQDSIIPITPAAVTYYDESHDSDQVVFDTVILKEIFDADTESEDLDAVRDENVTEETKGTALKLPNGREALSDEEDIYGRRDIQRIAPKKSVSETFCCVNRLNETIFSSVNGREFVRFSSQLPLPRKDRNETETALKWHTSESNRTQAPGAQNEIEELPEKDPKKGKRRRKRRNNKRNTLENPNSLAVNEANDEVDKGELEQGTLNTNKRSIDDKYDKQKATVLQGKATTPQKAELPAQKLIEKNRDIPQELDVSPQKTGRKKKDKTKKQLPTLNNVHTEKRKTRVFGFLMRKNAVNPEDSNVARKNTPDPNDCGVVRKNTTIDVTGKKTADPKNCDPTRKNTADPKGCHEERKTKTDSNSPCVGSSKAEEVKVAPVAKITSIRQNRVEEENDRDVISLYDDID